MKKTRVFAVILALLIAFTMLLAGCGSSSGADSGSDESADVSSDVSAEETAGETEDLSQVIPEHPDYDEAYEPVYERIRHEDISDYAYVYFADTNDDGVVEMWIEGGAGNEGTDEFYEVYTVRGSGAVLLERVDGSWIQYETIMEFPHPYQFFEMYGIRWPGMDTILEADGAVSGLPYEPGS